MSVRELAREAFDAMLASIIPPELPARSQMDEQKLDELTASIARIGVVQRLIVVRVGALLEVVAGHRRFLAACRAGLVTVPVDCYATKEAALEAVKHAENRFREDMSPAEEAIWFGELLERDYGNDIEALAAGLGEKVSYVDGRLQLLRGDSDVLQALMDKKISIGVAHELNKIRAEDYRRYYLHHAITSGATVSTVSGWVMEWKNLYGDQGERAPVAAPEPAPIVPQAYDPLRCVVCRQATPGFIPEQLSVHTHCKLAILDKLIAAYHGDDGSS